MTGVGFTMNYDSFLFVFCLQSTVHFQFVMWC